MNVPNVVLILLVVCPLVSFRIGLAKGHRRGYNHCLEANSSAFETERERLEHQRALIKRAFAIGKLTGQKISESKHESND